MNGLHLRTGLDEPIPPPQKAASAEIPTPPQPDTKPGVPLAKRKAAKPAKREYGCIKARDLKPAVKLPEGEALNEWLAVNIIVRQPFPTCENHVTHSPPLGFLQSGS